MSEKLPNSEPSEFPGHAAAEASKYSRLAVFIVALLVGAGAGLLVLNWAFTRISTDVQRLGIILESFNQKETDPRIVVFGNSALMSGIDAGALSSSLPGNPLAWNTASTGQSLLEAYLLTQEIPRSVNLAVYGLFIRPGPLEDALHPNKYNTLFMFGYRPNPRTVATVEEFYSSDIASQLRRSRFSQIFSSRWAFRQFLDTQSRILLRADLAIAKSTRDLLHPQSYKQRIKRELVARLVESRNRSFAERPPALGDNSTELAIRIAEQAVPDDRATMFLFSPIHPDVLKSRRPLLLEVVSEFKKDVESISSIRVVDATDLLSAGHFIDDLHPTDEGARILTKFLAQAIENNP